MHTDSASVVQFRPFLPPDRAELERMIFALYREDEYGQPVTSEKIRVTVDTLSHHPERGKILVFAAGEELVGYAILIYYWSNEYGGELVTIDELYVKESWRNRGIGTRFLESLVSEHAGGAKGIQLEVTPFNRRALAYYERRGFRRSGNTLLIKLV